LVTVTVCAALVEPSGVTGNTSAPGCNNTEPAAPPAPVSSTVAAFWFVDVTAIVPAAVPFTAGVKITPTVQLAPAARLLPQVLALMLKGAAVASDNPVAVVELVFVIVAVCAALAWPSVATVKVICAGLTLMPALAVPVPLKATVAGFTPGVGEAIASTAALPPAVAGVKITWTVQLAPLASVVPQVVAPVAKLLAEMPVTEKLRLAIDEPPELVIVSVCGALATLTVCEANVSDAGLTVMAAACRPVPESATVCVCSTSVTVSVPVAEPLAVGKNVTLMEQLALAARFALQVDDSVNGPETETPIDVSGIPPPLVSVTACEAEG